MAEPTHGGDTFILTFPGYMILDRESPPTLHAQAIKSEWSVLISSPKRTRPVGWSSQPPLSGSLMAIFDATLAGIENLPPPTPLCLALNTERAFTIALDVPETQDHFGKYSADSVLIRVIGPGTHDDRETIAVGAFDHICRLLRVRTQQYWLGRREPFLSSPIQLSYEMTDRSTYSGKVTGSSEQILVHGIDVLSVSAEIFRQAVADYESGVLPLVAQEAVLDVTYQVSRGETLLAVVLASNALEMMRDQIYERLGKKPKSTDLIRHLSDDLEAIINRNLKKEQMELFQFLQSLWVARGNVAHGKPFFWKASPGTATLPRGFTNRFADVTAWVEALSV